MKAVIRKNSAARHPYYFAIIASNGEPIAQSEMYARKEDAISAIGLIRVAGHTIVIDDATREV